MADWRTRSSLSGDVVFFRYVPEGLEKNNEEVFVWDLDKTYLDSSWGSISDLFRTIMERAFNKKNVPGTKTLLQTLSQNWLATRGNKHFPLYFITASPPQMEERIMEKLEYDRLRPFGCFYKDNLRNLKPGRLWRLTKQVGYKLQALLQLRTRLKENVRQVFWGDDSESDAIIYNLYSDICSRRIGPQDIRDILKSLYVTGEQTDTILLLQSQIPEVDPVDKIYINLADDTDPDYYLKFGRRTIPTLNAFQIALDLCQDDRLHVEHLLKVAQDMIINYGFTNEQLSRSFDDLIRRQVLVFSTVEKLLPILKEKNLLLSDYTPSVAPVKVDLAKADSEENSFQEPWVPERIDYLHDYR